MQWSGGRGWAKIAAIAAAVVAAATVATDAVAEAAVATATIAPAASAAAVATVSAAVATVLPGITLSLSQLIVKMVIEKYCKKSIHISNSPFFFQCSS